MLPSKVPEHLVVIMVTPTPNQLEFWEEQLHVTSKIIHQIHSSHFSAQRNVQGSHKVCYQTIIQGQNYDIQEFGAISKLLFSRNPASHKKREKSFFINYTP